MVSYLHLGNRSESLNYNEVPRNRTLSSVYDIRFMVSFKNNETKIGEKILMVLRNKRKQKTMALLLLTLVIGIGVGGIFLTEIANLQTGSTVGYAVLFQADRFVDTSTIKPSAWIWDETDAMPAENGGSWFQSIIDSKGVADNDIFSKSAFETAKIRGYLTIAVWTDTAMTSVTLYANDGSGKVPVKVLDTVQVGHQFWQIWDTNTIADGVYTFTLEAEFADGGIPDSILTTFGMSFVGEEATAIPDNTTITVVLFVGVVLGIYILLKRAKKRR